MKILVRLACTAAMSAALATALSAPGVAAIGTITVERDAKGAVTIAWKGEDPVDVYEAEDRNFHPAGTGPVASGVRGQLTLDHAQNARTYYIIKDHVSGQRIEVAERVVPLQQGSNFRDLGGYEAAGGKSVRWGLIYRSAGQPLLTPQDVAAVRGLGIDQLVDLRSNEERAIAPSRVTQTPITSINYSLGDLISTSAPHNGVDVYRNFPKFLAPQLKIIFADLLHKQAPLAFNCSAGQDRTGFVTAMVLSALGVKRETIVQDYLLSTRYRRPEWEMPELNPADHPNDPAVRMFSQYRQRPNWKTPDRLIDDQGRPFLVGAFEEIDAKWGSVDSYLQTEIGLSNTDLENLRALYLE